MMNQLRTMQRLLLAWVLGAGGLFSGSLLAQHLVSGSVVSTADNSAMIGLTVVEEGTSNGTLTDENGAFSIEVSNENATLLFNFVGYERKTVTVRGRSVLKIDMNPISIDEVVVIGYGTQKKRELTGAIVQIKSEDINRVATSDLATAIQGQLAGVSVRNGSGRPGENSQIIIRGITSFQEGGSEPLYVVDGVTYLSNPNITPQEIESIEVLKDGASAAIYGARASAGVILITTKQGKEGLHVNFDSYYGFQNITSVTPVTNTLDHLYVVDLEQRNNTSGQFNPLTSNPGALENDTDWYDLLQVDNAPMQNYTLGVNGGGKALKYSVVGTYFNQRGSLLNSNYEKYSIRSNANFKKGGFSAQANLGINISDQSREPWALMFDATRMEPFRPAIDLEAIQNLDDPFTADGTNPERIAGFAGKLMQENTRDQNQMNGNLRLGYEIIEGLSLNVNAGGSINKYRDRLFVPSFRVFDLEGNEDPSSGNDNTQLRHTDVTSTRTILEMTATYNRTFGGHKINLLAGNTYESSLWNWSRTGADFITSVKTPTLKNGTAIAGQQTVIPTRLYSWLGRAFYSYKGRYMVSGVIRRDASSNFGPENRVGIFPSMSAGWSFSEEAFMSSVSNIITLGKVRFGYGNTGNDRIPAFSYSEVVISNVDYPFGPDDLLTNGATQPGFADPGIKWETNVSQNLGLDLEFWNGRAGMTADIYQQDKRDMLLRINTPVSAGATPVDGANQFLTNIGNLQNRGFELSAFYSQQVGKLNLKFSGMFTRNINTVISLSREGEVIFGGKPNIIRQSQTNPVAVLKEGLPVGAFYVFETDGVIKDAEELAAYRVLVPEAQLGDLRYVDMDGDSTLTNDDKVFKGSGQPDFEYGFNINASYRGFDLVLQLYGVHGSTVYNGPKQWAYSTKRHKDLVYGWSTQNPTSDVPTPRTSIEHLNVQTDTDYFLEDGSFLRLRTITLGYSLPQSVLRRFRGKSVRIYVNAQNPITWTRYTGFDPEVASANPFNLGLDQGKYPISSVYLVGLNIKF